jgi:hypothetical protein
VWNNPSSAFENKERIFDADTGGASVEPHGTPTMEELVLKRKTSKV